MKTPWSNLLQYGVAIATLTVLCAVGVIVMMAVGTAIVISKFLVLIR